MWEPGRVGTPLTSEALSTLSTTAVCIWLYAGPLTTITSGCTRSKRLQFGAQAPVTCCFGYLTLAVRTRGSKTGSSFLALL